MKAAAQLSASKGHRIDKSNRVGDLRTGSEQRASTSRSDPSSRRPVKTRASKFEKKPPDPEGANRLNRSHSKTRLKFVGMDNTRLTLWQSIKGGAPLSAVECPFGTCTTSRCISTRFHTYVSRKMEELSVSQHRQRKWGTART